MAGLRPGRGVATPDAPSKPLGRRRLPGPVRRLVRRDRDRLELEIGNFHVAELDGIVVGCCALYPLEGGAAELACVAVHESYRRTSIRPGIGARLLAAAEQAALDAGLRTLFVLTTQTRDWFVEHGFEAVPVSALPARQQAMYNYQRNSIVMTKHLEPTHE